MARPLLPKFAVALALVAAAGCASPGGPEGEGRHAEPHRGQSTGAITHGQADTDHPAVVGIGLLDPCVGEAPTVVCTGTVVAPRVVVTAAHCLDFPHELGRVFFGENLEASGDGVPIAGAWAHADFDAVTYLGDIGVVFLREDAPVAPVPLRRSPLGPADVGAPVRIVGYGLTHAAADRPGLRRSGTSVIAAVEATRFRTVPDPSMSCQLDSGGPVLMTMEGQEVLAGITSSGDPFCKEYGLNTRVDAFVESFLAPALASSPPAPPPPVECAEVHDCTIRGCPAGEVCNTVSGACSVEVAESRAALEPGGGCALAPAPRRGQAGGGAALAALAALVCARIRATNQGRHGCGQPRGSS